MIALVLLEFSFVDGNEKLLDTVLPYTQLTEPCNDPKYCQRVLC